MPQICGNWRAEIHVCLLTFVIEVLCCKTAVLNRFWILYRLFNHKCLILPQFLLIFLRKINLDNSPQIELGLRQLLIFKLPSISHQLYSNLSIALIIKSDIILCLSSLSSIKRTECHFLCTYCINNKFTNQTSNEPTWRNGPRVSFNIKYMKYINKLIQIWIIYQWDKYIINMIRSHRRDKSSVDKSKYEVPK